MEKNEWEKLIEKLVKAKFLSSPKVIDSLLSIPRLDFLPENSNHLEDFISYNQKSKSKNTCEAYKSDLKKFFEFF